MKNKLKYGILVAVILIVLMIAGGQIILSFYRVHSEKLIIEYYEINALQEYKLKMNLLLMLLSQAGFDTSGTGAQEIPARWKEARESFDRCNQYLTHKHRSEEWNDLVNITYQIERTITGIGAPEAGFSYYVTNNLSDQVSKVIGRLEPLIAETREEIEHSENINQKVIQHGTFTLLGFGVSVVLILLIGGKRFINNLTEPIHKLKMGAESIRAGDRQTRVQVYSGDEFEQLAGTFNSMLDSLDATTVTKEYFQNIVNSLYGGLFVLTVEGKITAVNLVGFLMFEYSENELLGNSLSLLLDGNLSSDFDLGFKEWDFQQKVEFFSKQPVLISKSGKRIPVMINCTQLNNQQNNSDEILIVAHDITDKILLEKKIEQNRNEIRVAINEAQEEERIRLAKDLHDSLGQQLTGISYAVQRLCDLKRYSDELVQSIQMQVDGTLRETRRLSQNLIPIVLIEFGLVTAIQNLLDTFNKLGKTKFQFFYFDIQQRMDPKMEKAVYRICQEAVNNIMKHSHADNASIQFFQTPEQFTVIIEDNGVGFTKPDPDTAQTYAWEGIGLHSIQERVTSFNGKFIIESQPGEGTEIIIELPIDNQFNNEKNLHFSRG